jgi:hypothetical protein
MRFTAPSAARKPKTLLRRITSARVLPSTGTSAMALHTADSRTGYTPTEAPILRKKTINESMKLPTAAPVWTGLGTMKTRINMMINSVDSHFGIQTG